MPRRLQLMQDAPKRAYGIGDSSFQAAGGLDGITRLVDNFYDLMDQEPHAKTIRSMHPTDLAPARDKLARFLAGWMNGPELYTEKYGSINIPRDHAHLAIGEAERDSWLACMKSAIKNQPWDDDFRIYLFEQLSVPAERIRLAVAERSAAASAIKPLTSKVRVRSK